MSNSFSREEAGVCWLDFYSNGYDWDSDNIHANAIGSYISAVNIYYAIWRYKVVGYYKDTDGSWVYGTMSPTLFLTVE